MLNCDLLLLKLLGSAFRHYCQTITWCDDMRAALNTHSQPLPDLMRVSNALHVILMVQPHRSIWKGQQGKKLQKITQHTNQNNQLYREGDGITERERERERVHRECREKDGGCILNFND